MGCSGSPYRCMNIFRILTRGVGMGSVLENKQTDEQLNGPFFMHCFFAYPLAFSGYSKSVGSLTHHLLVAG